MLRSSFVPLKRWRDDYLGNLSDELHDISQQNLTTFSCDVAQHQTSTTGVSENSGFSPQIIHYNRVLHYKPSILGYPYFWKHPYSFIFLNFSSLPGEMIQFD